MNTSFTLEDIIKTLKLVNNNERADNFVAVLLNVSVDNVWEIEDNFEE